MEYGLDELHAISFTKGCYVGQEVTTRIKIRGLVRKRLVPIRVEGAAPEAGTPVMLGNASAGEVRRASGKEFESEKSFPMEYGLDELHAISFTKGCYVGQEVTTRIKIRGLVRKRLVPIRVEGAAPEAGTPVMLGNASAGEVRRASGNRGLALIRLELLEKAIDDGIPFEAGAARLFPYKPQWVNF